MLEIESSQTCDSGLSEEAEVHWEEDKKLKLARCSNLKHTFQRTARDCPDVKFLMLEVCCSLYMLPTRLKALPVAACRGSMLQLEPCL